MMRPEKIRLFIKPYCGWCRQVMRWLNEHGIQYEVLDVIGEPRAYEEMVRLSGQTLAPVMEADQKVLADFGAQELEAWWRQQGFEA